MLDLTPEEIVEGARLAGLIEPDDVVTMRVTDDGVMVFEVQDDG